MNCECISRVDGKLKDAGLEYRVSAAIVFDKKMDADTRLEVETYWINVIPRSRKKKPPSILCTFCPFCGIKAVPEQEPTPEKA